MHVVFSSYENSFNSQPIVPPTPIIIESTRQTMKGSVLYIFMCFVKWGVGHQILACHHIV